jgi:hypothetical protein
MFLERTKQNTCLTLTTEEALNFAVSLIKGVKVIGKHGGMHGFQTSIIVSNIKNPNVGITSSLVVTIAPEGKH